jgi:hypothetical protein
MRNDGGRGGEVEEVVGDRQPMDPYFIHGRIVLE